MKVLQIVADGNPGGGTTVVLSLAEGLRARGVDAQFVGQLDSYAIRSASAIGLPTHGVGFFPRRISIAAIRATAALLRREKPALVHAHGARAALNVILARLLPGVPRFTFVYSVHGYHLGGGKGLMRILGSLTERLCHKVATANVFVCRYDRGYGIRHGFLTERNNPRVIHNGIQLHELPPPAPPDLKLIVFLGRLTAQKNPLILLDVAERLRDDGFRFKIVGGGDMENAVRDGIKARMLDDVVTMTGALPRAQALVELRNGGALILPSLWEGLPMVLAEAMAMRVPVVASAVSGIPELVRDGETGILVHGQDANAYASAIRRLSADQALRGSLLGQAEALVRREYLAGVMVDRHAALYTECIAMAPPGPPL